jgi:hypothetical protein
VTGPAPSARGVPSHSWRPTWRCLGSCGVDDCVGGVHGRALTQDCYCAWWLSEGDKKRASLFRTTHSFPLHHRQTAEQTTLHTCQTETACSHIHVITGIHPYFCDKDETSQHLVIECPIAKNIWCIVHMAFGIYIITK